MRSRYLTALALIVGLAGCSRSKLKGGENLDLVLSDGARPARVASALEIWGKDKPRSTAAAVSGARAPRHAPRRTRTHHRAAIARRAPRGVPDQVPTVAAAPAPRGEAQTAPAAAAEPTAPRPAEPQQGHGGLGGLGGILRGIGGVIILRGGHSGMDPCDEHDRGSGGIPTIPGRGGRFPGGIVFLRGS